MCAIRYFERVALSFLLMLFSVSTNACESFAGRWALHYLGPISGAAYLELEESNSSEAPALLYLKQPGDVLLRLQGRASCNEHKIVMTFGGGNSSDGQFRILGGTMVGLLDTTPFSNPFGSWEFSVIRLTNFEELPMQGYWRMEKNEG
jgi:hypothetical protein